LSEIIKIYVFRSLSKDVTSRSASRVSISGYQLILGNKSNSFLTVLQSLVAFEKVVIPFHTAKLSKLSENFTEWAYASGAWREFLDRQFTQPSPNIWRNYIIHQAYGWSMPRRERVTRTAAVEMHSDFDALQLVLPMNPHSARENPE
jgi:hypothetical protein